jgi:hypothetical protein
MIKLAVFLCGAVVMSYEMLGSRVLAPNFGNSVFVWGSLISVFLAGLSAGYYLGGRLADLQPTSRKLALLIAGGGMLLTAFPLYGTEVCDLIFDAVPGVRTAPLVASMILFFIPSVLLGAVSPYTARLLLCSLHTSGKTIGGLYALSTLGSIAGTLLTSFYLITIAGTQTLIVSQGILLIALACMLWMVNLTCGIAAGDGPSAD